MWLNIFVLKRKRLSPSMSLPSRFCSKVTYSNTTRRSCSVFEKNICPLNSPFHLISTFWEECLSWRNTIPIGLAFLRYLSNLTIFKNFQFSEHCSRESLRKKCPYLELFWSAFPSIRTEYGKMRNRITPNTNTFQAVNHYVHPLVMNIECNNETKKLHSNKFLISNCKRSEQIEIKLSDNWNN